jgi:hypothetical protein
MNVALNSVYPLTAHAISRMEARGLPLDCVNAALAYGRAVWIRGARIFAIGRREVARYRNIGLDLEQFQGIQVVTSPDGAIVTAYRNRDFRGLQGRRRRWHLRRKRAAA